MLAVLGLLGLAGTVVFIVLLVMAFFKRKPKKPRLIGAGVCFLVFVVCVVATPNSPSTMPVAAPPPESSSSRAELKTREEYQAELASKSEVDPESKESEPESSSAPESESSSEPVSSSVPELESSSEPLESEVESSSSVESQTEPKSANILLTAPLVEKPVLSGSGQVLGDDMYAYVEVPKDLLKTVTAEDFKEFADTYVNPDRYNWVAIICDDGTGICFAGANIILATYGNVDTDGAIIQGVGNIMLSDNAYTYTPY